MIKKLSQYCLAGLITLIVLFEDSKAQSSEVTETSKFKWIDLRIGLVGDLEGTGMEFPGLSLGVGGNYRTKPILYSLRLNFNKEMGNPADAPPNNRVWDIGVLIGKYFEGGSNRNRKIALSTGLSMILGTEYISTGMYSSNKNTFATIGFPIEAKVFWTRRKLDWGFAAIANLNSRIHYFGGILYFPIGSFQ